MGSKKNLANNHAILHEPVFLLYIEIMKRGLENTLCKMLPLVRISL